MTIFTLLPLLCLIVNSSLLFYLLINFEARDRSKSFIYLVVATEFILLRSFLQYSSLSNYFPMYTLRIGSFFWLMIPVFFLNFCHSIIGKKRDLIFFIMVGVASITALIAASTNLYIESYKVHSWGVLPVFTGYFIPFLSWGYFILLPYSLYLLFNMVTQVDALISVKKNIIAIILTCTLTLIFALILQAATPLISNYKDLPRFGFLIIAAQILFIFISLHKMRYLNMGLKGIYDIVMSSVQEGIILIEDKRVIEMNSYSKDFFRISEKDFIDFDLSNVIKNYDHTKNYNNVEFSIFKNGDINREFYILLSKYPISKSTKESRNIVFFNDVTSKVEEANRIAEKEKKYKFLVENLQEGIIQVDKDGITTFVSQKLSDMIGVPIEEIQGKHYTEFISAPYQEKAATGWKRRQSGVTEVMEFQIKRADSSDLDVLVTAHPTFNEKNEYSGALYSILDNSQRKSTEREKDELQKKLFTQSKLASVGSLAAGISHEINNPLAAIFISTDVLEGRLKNSDQDVLESIKNIDESSERIRMIVNGLRAYAKEDIEPKVLFNAHDEIRETITILEGKTKNSNISVKGKYQAEEANIVGNLWNFHQIMLNLFQNSMTAMKPDGGELLISTENTSSELKIKVQDSGVGIKKENLSKVFDAFYTTNPPGEGTGLGLSITQSMVNKMDGMIEVESTEGEGTTFSITIPYIVEKTEKRKNTKNLTQDYESTGDILLVDDEENIRKSLSSLLGDMGFTVDEAANGEEALECLQSADYDYVITDILMPRMRGDELIKQAKNKLTLDKTKFLLITGKFDSDHLTDDDKEVLKIADSFITKPFRKTEVQNALLSLKRRKT